MNLCNRIRTYKVDYSRNIGGGYTLRFLFAFRLAQASNCLLWRIVWYFLLRRYRLKYGLEISPKTNIGKGLYIGHAFNITINPEATIGEFCNIHKGVVIGRENRGLRIGAPIIGNNVWIGINAAIVGKVEIGDDVLIAPNSFVNRDVPSHSIVYGNPCIIKYRANATEGYVNNL